MSNNKYKNIPKMIWKYIDENINSILLYGISWITSIIVLRFAIPYIDKNYIEKTHMIVWYLIIGGIVLLFLPFFKKIKIGALLELEREIKKAKEEITSFRSEVVPMLTNITTNIGNISSKNTQTTVVNVKDLQKANKTLSDQSNPQIENTIKKVKENLIIEDEDNVTALTKARIEMENLLKGIIDKKSDTKRSGKDSKYLSPTQLNREFLYAYPEYRYLENSLGYVQRLGNAAEQAQMIPEFQSEEGVELSSKVIGTLEYISEK